MCEHPITIRLPGCESEATHAPFGAAANSANLAFSMYLLLSMPVARLLLRFIS